MSRGLSPQVGGRQEQPLCSRAERGSSRDKDPGGEEKASMAQGTRSSPCPCLGSTSFPWAAPRVALPALPAPLGYAALQAGQLHPRCLRLDFSPSVSLAGRCWILPCWDCCTQGAPGSPDQDLWAAMGGSGFARLVGSSLCTGGWDAAGPSHPGVD